MKTILTLMVIFASLVTACKGKQISESGTNSAEQTAGDEHKDHLDEFTKMLGQFEAVSSKITDETSFDQHLKELTELNVKLQLQARELGSLKVPSAAVKKNMAAYLKTQQKKWGMSPAAKLPKLNSRKDEVAVIMEEYDKAVFAYAMYSYRIYIFDPKSNKYGGKLSSPPEAHVDVSDETLSQFSGDLKSTLFRYLAGNPRWEIREERGKTYAVRLESGNGYQTTLNGFLSSNGKQTRVLISFGKEYGFGRQRDNVTESKTGIKKLPVIIESPHAGTPGNSSYTIISGGDLFLEVYDQAPELKRSFTQTTFTEISAELKDVIKYQKEIDSQGIMPEAGKFHYPVPLPTKASFKVLDGGQPGIFNIKANITPTQAGKCYVKVFNVKTGDRLSEGRLTPRSTRHTGWSVDGKNYFPYSSQVTVYEGNWTTKYEARFELWHIGTDGTERKLAETQLMINGWQR